MKRFFLLCLCLTLAYGELLRDQEIPTSREGLKLILEDLPGEGVKRKQLSTVLDGKKYPIDRLISGIGVALLDGYQANAGLPAWLLDPSGNYFYYMGLTGCGFESDGMVLSRSDLQGKKIEPILGRCDNLKIEILKR